MKFTKSVREFDEDLGTTVTQVKPDEAAMRARSKREQQVWSDVWSTPQAAAWIGEPWRWLTIAHYCRMTVRVEQAEASAAEATAMLRLQEQVGLTPAGLVLNGWEITADEVGERREAQETVETPTRDRGFKIVR